MTTTLHPVEAQPPLDVEPPITHLLTGAHAEAVLRLAALTLEAARDAGDHIEVHIDASPAATRIEILVERR